MRFIETITLKQVYEFIVGAIAALSIFIEFSNKIHFRPWSFLFSHIGRAFNSGINAKLSELEEEQQRNTNAINSLRSEMESKFNEKEVNDDKKESKRLRARIIDFADSCRVHQHHTQTAFENIFRDYSDYLSYCEKHNIPNHFIDEEYRYISDVYAECQRENKFL